MVPRPDFVRVSPSLSVATSGNVYFMYVLGELSPADLRAAYDLHVSLIGRCPQGTGVMAIAAPNTAIPDAEVRELASRMMRDLGMNIRACTTVILGGGFWASAARSFLSAVYFVAKQPCPTKAMPTVDEGAAWLGPRAGQIPSQIAAVAHDLMTFSENGRGSPSIAS